ncbi:hypothetical protein [Pseudomonas sp. Pse1]|uniref:hypothetical protein n=1 Tax=Pseudomonas sp. Pse1 TaxID=2926020 RepID=UPI003565361C
MRPAYRSSPKNPESRQRATSKAELFEQVLEPVFALAIAGIWQAGPDVPALLDSGFNPSGMHVRQRPAFANVLQDQ